MEKGIETKISEDDERRYLSFLDGNLPLGFQERSNTAKYVGGNPGAFYLTIERNGYLGNNQKDELNKLIMGASKENVVAVMDKEKFRPIERIRNQLDGHEMHVLMGVAGPTAQCDGDQFSCT